MNRHGLVLLLGCFLLVVSTVSAEHIVVCGGPALRKWEDLRTVNDRHDKWWANFIRACTLRIDELRAADGNSRIVWMVYRPGFDARSKEDSKPYTQWIQSLADQRKITLVWFSSGGGFIQAINGRPNGSIQTFDYFGHSNRYSFMFDYGSDIMAASTAWLHENDIKRIDRSIFAGGAVCKSWGCHTGESMSNVWEKTLGLPLIGAKGATNYTGVGLGMMPSVTGSWTR